jgi:hypothetical protein
MSDLEMRCTCGLWLEATDISTEHVTVLAARWLAMLNTHRCPDPPLRAVVRSAKPPLSVKP